VSGSTLLFYLQLWMFSLTIPRRCPVSSSCVSGHKRGAEQTAPSTSNIPGALAAGHLLAQSENHLGLTVFNARFSR
jgi:hypothetical protein